MLRKIPLFLPDGTARNKTGTGSGAFFGVLLLGIITETLTSPGRWLRLAPPGAALPAHPQVHTTCGGQKRPPSPSGVDSPTGKRRLGSRSSHAEPRRSAPQPLSRSAHKRPTLRKFALCSQELLPGMASHRCGTKIQRQEGGPSGAGGWCCCCGWFGTPLAPLLPGLRDPVGLHFCIRCLSSSNLADASLGLSSCLKGLDQCCAASVRGFQTRHTAPLVKGLLWPQATQALLCWAGGQLGRPPAGLSPVCCPEGCACLAGSPGPDRPGQSAGRPGA